jgi:hypothetical protein
MAFDGADVAEDETGSVGGALSIGQGAVFRGALEDGSLELVFSGWNGSVYERRYEMSIVAHQPDEIIVFPESVLPPAVSWSAAYKNEAGTLQIILSLHETDLPELIAEQDLMSPIYDIIMGLTVLECPIMLDSVHLQFAAPLERLEEVLSRRSTLERGEPVIWASREDYERTLVEARREKTWKNETIDELRRFAASWPGSHLERWRSVSTDGKISIPAHGGHSQIFYPLACEDGTTPTVNTTESRIFCADGVNGVHSEKWPSILWQMQHDELAEAVLKLGMVYQFTGDPFTAAKVWDVLILYGELYPTFAKHTKYDDPGEEPPIVVAGGKVSSQALDEAIWLRKMVLGFDCVRSEAPSSTIKTLVENGIFRTGVADVLIPHNTYGNHQTFHNMAMVSIALSLEDWVLMRYAVDAPNGAQLGGGSVYYQLENMVESGGFWFEGSIVYQMVVLQPFLDTAQDLLRIGINLYTHHNGILKDMAMAPLLVAMPDYTLPPVNDAFQRVLTSYSWLYELVHANVVDERIDFLLSPQFRRHRNNYNGLLFGATVVDGVAAPPTESVVMEDAGFGVLRVENEAYTLIDFGPHGGSKGGHGHFDKLGIITYAVDKERGHDPGTVAYSMDSHYTWDKATVSHNTVVRDMENQLSTQGSLLLSHTNGIAPMVMAESISVYDDTSTYQRSLVLTNEYLLDIFDVASEDNIPKTWDWVYHDKSSKETFATVHPQLRNSFGSDNNQRWKIDESRAAALHDNNSSEFEHVFSGAQSDSGYQHISKHDSFVGDGEGWEIVFNTPPKAKDYEEFVLEPAGILGYVAGDDMDGTTQSAEWAALEGNFSSVVQVNVDFSTCTEDVATDCRSQLLFDTTADAIPTRLPSAATLFLKGNGAIVNFRLIDDAGTYFTKALPTPDSNEWMAVDTSDEEITDWRDVDFIPPLRGLAVQVICNGNRIEDSVWLADIKISFSGSDEVTLWTPVAENGVNDMVSGTRLLVMAEPNITRIITGVGLGIDRKVGVEDPVPMVVLRREAKATTFNVLHEFWRSNPGSEVISFSQVMSNSTSCSRKIHHIGGHGWNDWIALSRIVAEEDDIDCASSIGSGAFQVVLPPALSYCHFRLGDGDIPLFLSTKGTHEMMPFFETSGLSMHLEISIAWIGTMNEVRLTLNLPNSGTWMVKILALQTSEMQLLINDAQVNFELEDGFAVYEHSFPTSLPTQRPSVLPPSPSHEVIMPSTAPTTSTPTMAPVVFPDTKIPPNCRDCSRSRGRDLLFARLPCCS